VIGQHRLASDAFASTGDSTYIGIRFRIGDDATNSNTLIGRGGDSSSDVLLADFGASPENNEKIFLISASDTIFGLDDDGDHTIEVWGGTPAKYAVDGGSLITANNTWSDGFQRLVIGARSVNLTPSAWDGRIYRVVVRTTAPTTVQRQQILEFLSGGDFVPVNPPTDEDIFRATFAEASGREPYVSALINASDIQRLANHNVSLWAGKPGEWKGQPYIFRLRLADIQYGELHKFSAGKVIKVTANQPALVGGKNLLIVGIDAPIISGPIELTCMGWEDA